MKKTLAAILALVLTLSLCSIAWAMAPEDAVAKVGTTEYASLREAYTAASDGDTITLLKDCESERINLDKSVKVVLNGHTLKSTSAYGVMFCAQDGHKITIDGTAAGSKLVGTLMVTKETYGHIEINGGTYENAAYCPIYINGAVSTDDSTLTVSNATITALPGTSDQDEGWAIYLAGYSTSVLTNCTITAPVTGIEIRAGKLTLTNCNVTGGKGDVVSAPNGNGTTVQNTAVAVAQHNTKKVIEVTINGGEFHGTAALYQIDVQPTGSEAQQLVSTTINSGTFDGSVSKGNPQDTSKLTISGGTFASSVREYVVPALQYEVMTTVNESNNEYTYTYFTKYEDAVTYAESTVNKSTIDLTQGSTNMEYVIEYADGTGREVTLRVVNGQDFELPTLTRTGYTFKGWKMNGSTEVYSTQQIKAWTGPMRDTNVLTAVWSANSYYYYPSTTTDTTKTDSPKTFDAGVALYAGMALASLTGLAYTGKKKF